jgi:hypothetical protein
MQGSSRVEAGYKHPIKQEARNIRKKVSMGKIATVLFVF